MRICFSDGMTFDTSGPLRVVKETDGWYVVGRGMLIAVDSESAGREQIRSMEDRDEDLSD